MAECSYLNEALYFQVSLPGAFKPELFHSELTYASACI